MESKVVRINGLPFHVPLAELTDPSPDRPAVCCSAREPAAWGQGACTLAPHEPYVLHIAHDPEGNVVALWAQWLAEYPTELAVAADTTLPAERPRAVAMHGRLLG